MSLLFEEKWSFRNFRRVLSQRVLTQRNGYMEWWKIKRIPKLDRKYVGTKIWGILNIFKELCLDACSSSYNLTPPISRVLIGQHFIFCSLKSSTCCNSPRICTPVKYESKSWVSNCHVDNLDVLQFVAYSNLKVELENSKTDHSCLENLIFQVFLDFQSVNFLVDMTDIFNIEEYKKELNFDF